MPVRKLTIDEYAGRLRSFKDIKEEKVKEICSKIYTAQENRNFFEVGLARFGL